MHIFFPLRGISFYYPLSSADDPKIGLFGKVQFLCRELEVEHNFLGGNAVQCKCNYILKQMTELDTYLLDNLGSFTLSRQPYQFQYVEWVMRQKVCMHYALFGQLRVITPCID